MNFWKGNRSDINNKKIKNYIVKNWFHWLNEGELILPKGVRVILNNKEFSISLKEFYHIINKILKKKKFKNEIINLCLN